MLPAGRRAVAVDRQPPRVAPVAVEEETPHPVLPADGGTARSSASTMTGHAECPTGLEFRSGMEKNLSIYCIKFIVK